MLIAIDPGGKYVGWAFHYHLAIFYSEQSSPDEVWQKLEAAAASDRIEAIIYESYGRSGKNIDLRPVETIGVIKEWARQNKVPVVPQTPSEGKHFFTDSRLQEYGVLREPKTEWHHANDAMRHLQYYLKFKHGKEKT